jgi:hypothetical protein
LTERLIFFNLIKQEATLELLRDKWSTKLLIYPIGYVEDVLVIQIHLDAPVVAFFKWAYSIQAGQVLLHCYNLSLELFDPPAYMREALRELQSLKLLSE